MSWADELYRVYEQQCGKTDNSSAILVPLYHETKTANIEITLKENGDFVHADILTEEQGSNTIYPCQKMRTNNVLAYALSEELVYLAGDYSDFFQRIEKKKGKNDSSVFHDCNNSEQFNSYTSGLQKWIESEYTHPALKAIYAYITRKTLIHDLIDCHLLQLNENKKLIESDKCPKSKNATLKKAFVRFRIIYQDFEKESRTWCDQELFSLFEKYCSSISENKQLCYVSGEIVECTQIHASLGLPVFPNAKIISSNAKNATDFVYRGRFSDADQALSIGKAQSEKIHKALKWLINAGYALQIGVEKSRSDNQKSPVVLVMWSSLLSPLPNGWQKTMQDYYDDDECFDDNDEIIGGLQDIDELKKQVYGTGKDFQYLENIMLMAIQATNKGRVSVGMYIEMKKSKFVYNLAKWHDETMVQKYSYKQKKTYKKRFSVYEIIRSAFGIENEKGKLEVKPELEKDNVLRLLPCITQGRKLPDDIVQKLVQKASNPLAYKKKEKDKPDNHRTVLETACGMIRKHNIDRKEGVISMAYDPNEKDRSYLFGCLLAIADAAERSTFEGDDKYERPTNARRFWNAYVRCPAETWARIYGKLTFYFDKMKGKQLRYIKMIEEVKEKFTLSDYMNNRPLSAAYLLGYHHMNAEIYKKKEEE